MYARVFDVTWLCQSVSEFLTRKDDQQLGCKNIIRDKLIEGKILHEACESLHLVCVLIVSPEQYEEIVRIVFEFTCSFKV